MARGSAKGGGRGSGGGAGAAGGGSSAGAIRAGAAFVELFTKSTAFERGLKAASAMFKSWGANIAKLGGGMAAVGAGILAPVTAFLKEGIERAEHIGDIVDVFDLTAESASKMASAFEIAGGSIDELEMALGKLALANVEGKPLDKFFVETAKTISEMDDATERYQAAADIFGNKFARTFVDNAGDVLELLDGAPGLSKESIDNAKAFRMEWTRVGIAFKSALLPALETFKPFLKTVSQLVQQSAGYLPLVAGIGAGLVAMGTAAIFVGGSLAGVGTILGAVAGLTGAILSPLGLVTAGLVAGGLAWVAFSQKGGASVLSVRDDAGNAFASIKTGWDGVRDALTKGDFVLAMKIAFASVELAWAQATRGMVGAWQAGLTTMKEAMTAWKYAARSALQYVWAGIGQAIANGAEAVGLVPGGTANAVAEDRDRELKRIREEAVAESQRNLKAGTEAQRAGEARIKEMQAELDRLRNAARNDAAKALDKAGIGGAMVGSSTRGAFNFGNAAQFFGGTGNVSERQLKAQEEANKKLDAIRAALGGVAVLKIA